MEVPKIHLSPAETELMKNAEIILTKNRVLQKIKNLLEAVQEEQLLFEKENLLAATIGHVLVSPKISRGENYLGLPWLILDYPRQSSGNEVFFIRTMFWWGNFFSSTLHISGKYKQAYKEKIFSSFEKLGDYYLGVNADPWMHHFEPSNYQSIGSLTKDQFAAMGEMATDLKIAKCISLNEWESASPALYEAWKFLLQLCGLIS